MTNTQFERLIGALEIVSSTLSRVEDILLRNEETANGVSGVTPANAFAVLTADDTRALRDESECGPLAGTRGAAKRGKRGRK